MLPAPAILATIRCRSRLAVQAGGFYVGQSLDHHL